MKSPGDAYSSAACSNATTPSPSHACKMRAAGDNGEPAKEHKMLLSKMNALQVIDLTQDTDTDRGYNVHSILFWRFAFGFCACDLCFLCLPVSGLMVIKHCIFMFVWCCVWVWKKFLQGNLENALEKSDEVTLLRSDSNLCICCLTVMNICLRVTVAMCACVHMCVCACAITGILPKIKMDQPWRRRSRRCLRSLIHLKFWRAALWIWFHCNATHWAVLKWASNIFCDSACVVMICVLMFSQMFQSKTCARRNLISGVDNCSPSVGETFESMVSERWLSSSLVPLAFLPVNTNVTCLHVLMPWYVHIVCMYVYIQMHTYTCIYACV